MTSAVDLAALAATDARESIPQEALLAAMTSPPFIYVPGTFNTRDLGLVPSPSAPSSLAPSPSPSQLSLSTTTTSPSSSASTNILRRRYAYRSGALDGLTPDGKALVSGELGVRRIFDLRSEGERMSTPDPEVEGVTNVWTATSEKEATAAVEDFVEGLGEKGYEAMYLDVLSVYRAPFRDVLVHVRDRPDEPFLFHCTAGRDRTGVLAGLIQCLAGQDPDTTALDYMLSRIGTEVAREMLLAFVMKGTGATSVDHPGLYNLCSLRASSWTAFLAGVEREYGGFEGYARTILGFTDEDLATIKKNLSRDWEP